MGCREEEKYNSHFDFRSVLAYEAKEIYWRIITMKKEARATQANNDWDIFRLKLPLLLL